MDRPGPSERVTAACARLAKAEASERAARAELHAAIVADLSAGVRQADLARATGYSRERIRQITGAAREASAGQPASRERPAPAEQAPPQEQGAAPPKRSRKPPASRGESPSEMVAGIFHRAR